MIGLYRPGHSLLHRLPAGAKMLGLLAFLVGLFLLTRPAWLLVPAAVVAVGFVVARIPARVALAQLAPMRWFLPVLVVLQGMLISWASALLSGGGLLLAVAAAALVTLTTRVTALLDLMVSALRPLRRLGLDPDRVGLLLALTIRCVPLMVELVRQVGQASRARGAGFSLRALVAPTLVRALRSADALGEALIARGVDDDPPLPRAGRATP